MKSARIFRWNSVESQAGSIEDPIMRLRFLKVCAAATPDLVPAQPRERRKGLPAICFALLLAGLLVPGYEASNGENVSDRPAPHLSSGSADAFANVWLVDKSKDFETYSNGLRIDTRYTVSNDDRLFYPVYQRAALDPDQPEWRSEPAGIVYHTTESDQADFDPQHNANLKRIGRDVLNFIREKRCYHFFIDRFGQVYRVVRESDVAFHAGNSIWADGQVLYVNLNSSFLGIAFETQTLRAEDMPSANQAQIHSARVLTEMLRSKYHIPAANCVTHAQVSVNPGNMLIGYHTDWAGNFPFLDLGLTDNYTIPPPSIYAFGFEYDPVFVHATGVRLWEGLVLADDQTRIQAMAAGLTVPQYRSLLRHKYKQIIATLKAAIPVKETVHAT
jgi:N-acetylmuramoyl-L-alanine amidase-like protein